MTEQSQYSLLERDRVETEYARLHAETGYGNTIWSPLASGLLTGKYRHSTPSESRGASPQWQGFIDGLRSRKSDRIVEAVITAAEGLGTSPLGVALAWSATVP